MTEQTDAGPLNAIDLMRVVMDADNETRSFALRGTTNWAAHIGKAVQNAVIAKLWTPEQVAKAKEHAKKFDHWLGTTPQPTQAQAAVASPLTKLQRKAIAVCFTSDKVSVSEVQRQLSISYADAQTLCQSIVDLGLTDELELAPSLKRGAPASQPAPVAQGDALTDTYVQQVPDKCDRIVWRGRYYHLPIDAAEHSYTEPSPMAKVAAVLTTTPQPPTGGFLFGAKHETC